MEILTNSSTSINDLETLVNGVLNHGPDILANCLADQNVIKKFKSQVDSERLDYQIPASSIDPNNWFIPQYYKTMDIEQFLRDQCPAENKNRLEHELELFRKNNMIPVLKAMKYLVDTLRQHNIVWGVGRGSSVASYVLFLIGIHKVDSIKYNLPIEEFFKGEKNG